MKDTSLAILGAGLAHELRNPLNSALLQLALASRRLARAKHPVPGEIAEAARELHRAATLLEDFLLFARPQQSTQQQVDVSAIVSAALARVRDRAAQAAVHVTTSGGPRVRAELDPVRIERALVEALANAIDAARGAANSDVAIRWSTEGGSLVIEVEDHGPGIPSGAEPVFDAFYTTKPAGTGLGLAIVDRIVVDHGGTAELTRTGDATVFRMQLPIVAVA
jgi:two-component system sensor histidine kinase HydH